MLLDFAEVFFFHTKSITAATITTNAPIATKGMTKVVGTTVEFLWSSSATGIVGTSIGLLGGLRVVIGVISGTVALMYSSVTLVVLVVVLGDVNFGSSDMLGYSGRVNGGG